jgi:hypothetical protein
MQVRKAFGVMVAVSAVLVIGAGVGNAANMSNAPGAAKQGLVGPQASVFCNDVTPTPSDVTTTTIPGFVIFNQDQGAGTVSANVHVKGAEPNTTYVVRLIQGNGTGDDCGVVDATFTTNGQGNGGELVVEATAVGTTAIQVIVDTGRLLGRPTYRGAALYMLAA